MPLPQKKLSLVVSFDRTVDAMAMEAACRRDGVPGRMIPMPPQISAGCGMVWKADPSCRQQILDEMGAIGLKPHALHELMLS
ncbi:MAG: DUF3343 domain-containing protein [Coriobacteriales bacterium]|nr:DUF3343 domain-containing protein [Coriobacteriales bacterium]